MRAILTILFAVGLCFASSPSIARKPGDGADSRVATSRWSGAVSLDKSLDERGSQGLAASAVATTLVLKASKFDSGAPCTAESWTAVDLTQQSGEYWHVDDMAGLTALTSTGGIPFAPIQGSKSLWMGARPAATAPLCSYLALPGYGNYWRQLFCSKDCLPTGGGPTPDLDVAFRIRFDSEPSYDATTLEYTTDCSGNTGWSDYPYIGSWDGAGEGLVAGPFSIGDPATVKLRLRFTSDRAWSNEDGFYPGLGAMIDSLSWETTPVENFEGEAIGATASNDWQTCNVPGFGNYLALFKKTTGANYEDPCLDNLSCYWAALSGSTEFYACGNPPQPSQAVVPHKNARGQYLANEIWSPVIPLTGSGSDVRLRFTVYRDLPLDNLIFFVWHVRTIGASGCPGVWKDSRQYYYGTGKDWAIVEHAIGSKLDLNAGVSMQVALGVVDMCGAWCGLLGSGLCHSPAPYLDQVKVLRINTFGPQWDVRSVDAFQDTFAANGTLTGTARVDEAMDIAPKSSPNITPGDSAVVLSVLDPKYVTAPGTIGVSGLSNDPLVSTFAGRDKTKKAVYMYVSVWPQGQPGKSGAPLSEGPGGQANRYPFMATVGMGGVTWTKVRMDYTYRGTSGIPGDGTGSEPRVDGCFNVDLNDNLFTPGDTLCYFYSATSADGTTYFSTEYGTTTDINSIAANPMEMTILPAGGWHRGGEVLYVDGADGLGDQSYFDAAFLALGLNAKVDRYDVRAPESAVGNRLDGRVTSVAGQLSAAYKVILWDCGSVPVTLGDGSGDPEKTDDYALLNSFLGNLTSAGGVYLCGDRVAQDLNQYSGSGAVNFRVNHIPFTLISANHRLAPNFFPITPTIKYWPGRCFVDDFYIFGGCPQLNDFDVMAASGTSRVEMSYNTANNSNGAVLSNVNGNARVLLSGFSFAYIRDNELDGVSDRVKHLHDLLYWMGQVVTSSGPEIGNSLRQNYPNPFNPQTTIAFSIKARGHVSLSVYDVSGRLVRTLANETRAAGAYELTWDGRDAGGRRVASGVYFYKITAAAFTQTKKMVLLK